MKTLIVLIVLIVTMLITLSCVHYVPVRDATNDDPERTKKVLADSGYTDVHIVGECWNEVCQECFGTGFVARLNDKVVAGCMVENVYEYGRNPQIKLERDYVPLEE